MEEDFCRHSEEGWCIAVPVIGEPEKSQGEEPGYIVGRVETPYGSE
jgi:hypothetical protein